MTKMTSKVTWVSGLRFIGGSGSGHRAIMDGSQTSSSKEVLGPSPMEMVLMGLGGCSGIDVMHILERMRQTVTGCKVELEGERAEESPRVYKKIAESKKQGNFYDFVSKYVGKFEYTSQRFSLTQRFKKTI